MADGGGPGSAQLTAAWIKIMKVRFRQAGGYTGIAICADLDTDKMSVEEARALAELVDRADLGAFRDASAPPRGADLLSYEIELETAEGARRIAFTDQEKTKDVTALLSFLRKRATPRPGI